MFNIKSDGYYRSQLVAKEFSEIKGIDFDKLFSSVICYETTHLFSAVAALEDWDIHSVDIKIPIYIVIWIRKIHMKQPKDFRLPDKEKKV